MVTDSDLELCICLVGLGLRCVQWNSIDTVEPRYLKLALIFRITAYLEGKIWSLF